MQRDRFLLLALALVGCGDTARIELAHGAVKSAARSSEPTAAPTVAPRTAVDPAVAFLAQRTAESVAPEVVPATARAKRGARRELEFLVVNHLERPIELGGPGTSCGCVEIVGGDCELAALGTTPVRVSIEPRTGAILDYFTIPWRDGETKGELHVEIRLED